MSGRQKAKPKSKVAPKQKRRAVRKRPLHEKKPEKKIAELVPEKKVVETAPVKDFALVIRLKGLVAVPDKMEHALRGLKLDRKYAAVLLEKNQNLAGLLRRVKDYVTWGDLNAEAIGSLLRERGEVIGGLGLTDGFVTKNFDEKSVDELAASLTRGRVLLKSLWQKGIKPVFRLRPPAGGFDYSTKRPFSSRGELGDRGAQFSRMLARMI